MSNPTLRTIQNREFFQADLAGAIVEFNTAVETITAARVALSAEADEQRNAAITGRVDKPERLPAEAAKLTARRVALDIAEIKLIQQKETFQQPIKEAHTAERDRLAQLEQTRREEITAAFTAVKTDSRLLPGVLNGDARVMDLRNQRGALASFKLVIGDEDAERLAILQGRVSAVVPKL